MNIIRYNAHKGKSDDYHTLTTSNSTSPATFSLNKYSKTKKLKLQKVIGTTNALGRQANVIDFSKSKLLYFFIEYPFGSAGTGLSRNATIIVSLIDKKSYVMEKLLTIECNRIHESPDITYKKRHIYIVGSYFDNAYFDGVKLTNQKNYPSNEFGFIAKYKIR